MAVAAPPCETKVTISLPVEGTETKERGGITYTVADSGDSVLSRLEKVDEGDDDSASGRSDRLCAGKGKKVSARPGLGR